MVFNRVKGLLEQEIGIDGDKVTLEAHLNNDLGIDSLDVFELVMAIEDEFEIEVPNEELAEIKTVKEIVAYIEKKVA